MNAEPGSLAPFYKGWDAYQDLLVAAITPLTPDQLTLRAAPHLRSIGEVATHIVAVRVRWFHGLMAQGGAGVAPIGEWDRPGAPPRTAADLVAGLQTTWQVIQEALARWTPADLDYQFSGQWQGEDYCLTRQWVIWHVAEHDLHHGGELSYSLGMHGLAALDL